MVLFTDLERQNPRERLPKNFQGRKLTQAEYQKVLSSFGRMTPEEVIHAHFISTVSSWANASFGTSLRFVKEDLQKLKDKYGRISKREFEECSKALDDIDIHTYIERYERTVNRDRPETRRDKRVLIINEEFAAEAYGCVESVFKRNAGYELFDDVIHAMIVQDQPNYLIADYGDVSKDGKKYLSFDIPPARGFTPQRLRAMFVDALKRAAQDAAGNPEIEGLLVGSWIVRKNPKLAKQFGFTIESEEKGIALIPREVLLKKYGKNANRP